MPEPARAVDHVSAFKEGVEEFCSAHKAEIMAFVALQWQSDIRMVIAELLALRSQGEKK